MLFVLLSSFSKESGLELEVKFACSIWSQVTFGNGSYPLELKCSLSTYRRSWLYLDDHASAVVAAIVKFPWNRLQCPTSKSIDIGLIIRSLSLP